MPSKSQVENKRQRFAIYTRYSSEMQNEISLEAQEARCRQAVVQRGGTVVAVYSDSAKSGWSLDRDGFNNLRQAAERGKFDAVIFWKFDRLARNHDHVVMIKTLLRHEHNVKLYCVEGFSEDEDDSAYGAMMEQMIAVFSAFYSKNLSSETKRGKRQRAIKGQFNGSIAPIGYNLTTLKQATEARPAGLYIDPRAAALIRRAFRLYATGMYSDKQIAVWLNARPYMQRLRSGKLPFNKEMVRDMLQNRIYTGRVRHTDTVYKGSLGERRTSKRNRSEWFEGQHDGFVPDDLFDACQDIRAGLIRHKNSPDTERVYILHDRVYCARCIARKPLDLIDDNYGRMRAKWHNQRGYAHYRCMCSERGYEKCGQGAVPVATIDAQLVEVLSTLQIPQDYRERVDAAVRGRVENEAAFDRMKAIEATVERLNVSWLEGFLTKDDYVAKRRQLEQETASLRPIDYDTLIEAADLLSNFQTYWTQCEEVAQPEIARQQLVSKVVERIFVHEDRIIGLVLHGDFAVLLNEADLGSQGIREALDGHLVETKKATLASSLYGDDGPRLPACILLLIPPFAIIDNPLFNAFVRQLAASRNATWYFAPQAMLAEPIHC